MYQYRALTREQREELVRERLARGYPPHSPPHPVRGEPFYLLTAACYEHAYHMASSDRRQQVLDELFDTFTVNSVDILAWVVLPNHYHLLVHVPQFDSLGQLFRLVHARMARQWNLADATPQRKVWYRYADRAIRSEGHYCTTLNYIHHNPVKHGSATSPYDWMESSVHWYVRELGREWLRDLWAKYPFRSYGRGWDDP